MPFKDKAKRNEYMRKRRANLKRDKLYDETIAIAGGFEKVFGELSDHYKKRMEEVKT